MRIMKFGGSSLAGAGAIRQVGDLVARVHRRGPVHVVVSAIAGVTDNLLEAAEHAVDDSQRTKKLFTSLHARHTALVAELLPPAHQSPLMAEVQVLFNELEDVLHGARLVRECSRKSRDQIIAFGERLSAVIVAHHLSATGVPARAVDTRPLVVVVPRNGTPMVDRPTSYERLRRELSGTDEVAVVTGFIASTCDGITTNLGRNGSDATATLLAAALGADAVEIWTDVDGISSADPGLIADANVMATMTYEEAQEMAYFGAAIVHPQAIQPAAEAGIPVVVRNTFSPGHPGTTISAAQKNGERTVRGIATIPGVALVNVEGSGMIGVPGIAGRLFTTLATAGVNVILISQASSEHSICFVIRREELAEAVRAARQEFKPELELGVIQRVDEVDNLAVLAVIGTQMRGTVGLSGKLFGALGAAGVNVVAISQGSSERNISIVIAAGDTSRAVKAIHTAFELGNGLREGKGLR